MRILKYDDQYLTNYKACGDEKACTSETNLATPKTKWDYLADRSKYSYSGWVSPFVTGHKYKIHWGNIGVDYMNLHIEVSERWQQGDKSIYIVNNFTDVRAAISVRVDDQEVETQY